MLPSCSYKQSRYQNPKPDDQLHGDAPEVPGHPAPELAEQVIIGRIRMLDVALLFFFLHPKPDEQLHGDALDAPDHPALELAKAPLLRHYSPGLSRTA